MGGEPKHLECVEIVMFSKQFGAFVIVEYPDCHFVSGLPETIGIHPWRLHLLDSVVERFVHIYRLCMEMPGLMVGLRRVSEWVTRKGFLINGFKITRNFTFSFFFFFFFFFRRWS